MAKSLSSSSSSSVYRSIDRSNRTNEEEDEEIKLQQQLAEFGYSPEPWCKRHETAEAVLGLLKEQLGFTLPDALDLVGRFGVEAVEGAAIRCLAQNRDGVIRKPRGVLIWSLQVNPPRYWTVSEIEVFISDEWQVVLKRAEKAAGENITLRRLIEEAKAPDNVVRLRKAK